MNVSCGLKNYVYFVALDTSLSKDQLHLLMDGACFLLLHLSADREVVQPAAALAAASSLCKPRVLRFIFLLDFM